MHDALYDASLNFEMRCIHQAQDNNDILGYWLSNTSSLLLLLQRTLKAGGAAGVAPQRRRPPPTLIGRMTAVKYLLSDYFSLLPITRGV